MPKRASLRERIETTRRFRERAIDFARRIVAVPYAAVVTARIDVPERLVIAPQDLRTTDPTIAEEINSGYFTFAGKAVELRGRSPFDIAAPSQDWGRALTSFGWLRHLRAADTAVARVNARALVSDFLDRNEKPDGSVAWEISVVVRRALSFLAQSPMILENADHAFYRLFMRALAQLRYFLSRQIKSGVVHGEDRLFAAIGLAGIGLCAEVSQGFQRRSTRDLVVQLARQIYPDGGHVSRCADTLIRLLLDLLPLRQAYHARAIPAPPEILNAIDHMLLMLRLLRHGDGSLALFNGMGVTPADVLATVLAYEDMRTKPVFDAAYSGYQRIEGGNSVLIADAGRPPPPEFSQRAHAGAASFEFSVGPQRLIVNCGTPPNNQPAARDAARATAAHSTLIIDDTSSCRFAKSNRFDGWQLDEIMAGPKNFSVERELQPSRTRLVMSHDGYRARFETIHERQLILSADGTRLDGADHLKSVAKTPVTYPFAIRFHAHPSVKLASARNSRAALLDLPNGARWIFSAGDRPIAIEESIFFSATDGQRATRQLVIYCSAEDPPFVAWTLRAFGTADDDGTISPDESSL